MPPFRSIEPGPVPNVVAELSVVTSTVPVVPLLMVSLWAPMIVPGEPVTVMVWPESAFSSESAVRLTLLRLRLPEASRWPPPRVTPPVPSTLPLATMVPASISVPPV